MMADDGKIRSINSVLLLFIQTEIHDIRDDDDTPTPTHTDSKNLTDSIMSTFLFFFFVSSLTSPSAKRTNQAHDAGEIRLASQSQTYCLTVVAVSLPASPPLLIVLAIVFSWILSKTSSAG